MRKGENYALRITHYLLSYPQVIHNLCTCDTDVEIMTHVAQD